MQNEWHECPCKDVLDPITAFRLTRGDGFYPRTGTDTIWWSALLDLRNVSIDDFESRALAQFRYDVLLPNYYDEDERKAVQAEQLVTVYARRSFLNAANRQNNPFGVVGVELGMIIDESFLNPDAPPFAHGGGDIPVPADAVVTGVIDDGIAFANDLFRSGRTTSRVESIYIMASPTMDGGSFITLGRIWNKSDIDKFLADNTFGGVLDEDGFYRETGLIDHGDQSFATAALRRSHGTRAMALAAGFDMDHAPNDRPIVCAQLPSAVTSDATGISLHPHLNDAAMFIRNEARRFHTDGPDRRRPPLVVNFSFGNFEGPHDGTSYVSRLIENVLRSTEDQTIRVTLPAGNGNLSRCHARIAFDRQADEDRVTLDMRVQPEDRTCSFAVMWLPYSPDESPPDFIRVRVAPPGGPESPFVHAKAGSCQSLRNENGVEIAQLSYGFRDAPTNRGFVVLMINPTASLTMSKETAPPGLWRIEVEKVELAADEAVEVWIRRDETLPGYPPFGRQSYFDNPDYQRFDEFGAPLPVDPKGTKCPVRRAGTLSGFACGKTPLVIGGLTQWNGRLSDYSAAGPITPERGAKVANRDGPDASTRSDESPALPGVLSAGSRSGSMVRMNGTSVSAPVVARFVADALSRREAGDREWLCREARRQDHEFKTKKPAKTRTGCGRLDLPDPFLKRRREA